MTRAFAFFLFLLCVSLHSQTPGTSTLLSVNEGLSQGMVFDILQTRDGYLWIATKDGLNRYDGYRFEVFSNDAFDPFSIAANEIWQLFEDSRGWIWIVCPVGLDVFVPESGRFFHVLPQQMARAMRLPLGVTETPDGKVWLTLDGKVWKIDASSDVLEKAAKKGNAFPRLPYKSIEAPGAIFTSLCFTNNKKLLAGATNGLYLLDPVAETIQAKMLDTPLQIVGEDKTGQIWFNTLGDGDSWEWYRPKKDLWLFKDGAAKQVVEPCSPNCIYRFGYDGFLWGWQASENTIFKWKPELLSKGGKPEVQWTIDAPFTRTPQYAPTALAFDRSGIAWLGTNGFGILKINFAKPKFTSYLPFTSQSSITEDPQGHLFTSEDPNTIYASNRFDRGASNPWFVANSKQDANFTTFDPSGNLWVSNFFGDLFRFDAHTKASKNFPWKALGLITSKKGQLLGVTEEGLVQFDPATEQSKAYPFEPSQKLPAGYTSLHYLMEDATGTVWIFGLQGLIQATPVDGGYRFTYFKNNPADRSTLSNNSVLCVAEDPLQPGRFLWVGTKGGGLNRLDRQTGQFQHYKTQQGLPDNVVYGILSENTPLEGGQRGGHIWMSTNRGLCRFHTRKETVKNFTVADGLQSNEFNQASYLKTSNGAMIFGGVNGLTVFHPDSLQFNEYVPQTQIVSIKINNEPLDIGILGYSDIEAPQTNTSISQYPNLKLSHRQNLVTIEFAALEFTSPAQNQYRYQLIQKRIFGKNEGENWVELGYKNSVQFANLRPGSYTFKVLGSNNDGIWSELPAVLEFTIRPPWWASWWAYLVYAFLIGAGIWFYNRYQFRQKLEHQETLRLRELDEFKNRFFTNITHEFRTPLTVILGTSEQLAVGSEQWAALPERPAVKSKLGLIKRNGENLLRLINQLLDLAKLESNTLKLNYVQGDVLPYLRYIAESLHSLANAQNVMLKVESKEREIVMDYDPERLLQIVYNLLSNAVKFTPSGGRVDLRVTTDDLRLQQPPSIVNRKSSIVIQVVDTGAGIPPEDLPHIFDRFYQASNLEKAKAGGTGIGLALTKELVKAMGGDISVESEINKGTVFTVRLPISNKASTADATSDPSRRDDILVEPRKSIGSRSVGTASENTLQHAVPTERSALPPNVSTNMPSLRDDMAKAQILLIEDNPDVVEYLASCLENSGDREGRPYRLDFAYNGRAGIEKALETIPDLIVSDVMMPEKDGFEVCETLKNDERTSHIPIVLLTAKAGVESRIAGLRRGADAYLAKPFHQEELLVTLANLLEVRRKLRQKFQETAFQPLTSHFSPLTADMEDTFVLKVKTAILERLSDSKLNVEDLCRVLAMSQPQLHRKLTALTGKNASQFIRSLRLARAKELLLTKQMNVSEVAFEVGFDDPKYFSRVFTEEFGIAPSKI